MRYVLLFCGTADDQAAFDALSPDELRKRYGEVGRWYQENRDKIVYGDQLQHPTTATSVRHSWNGAEPVITDGPFIEGKEGVGGFVAVEVADLDEALRMAKTWPGRGVVEIRPVVAR